VRASYRAESEETGELWFARASLHQERQPAAVVEGDLRTHPRGDAEPGARAVEPRRAEDAVGVQQRDGGLAERGGPLGQRLRQGGGLEEAEGALGVQLDE